MFESVCRVPGCPTSAMVLPMLHDHPDSPSASACRIEIRWSPDGLAGPCANFLHGLCDKSRREGSNEMQRKLLDPEKNMKLYGMLKCFQVLNGDMISSISFHFRERNFGPGPICTGRNLPLRARWFHSNGPRPNCPQLTAAMQQMSSLEQTNA